MTTEERDRLEMIRNRVNDQLSCQAEAIQEGKFLRLSATVIEEAAFLLKLVDRGHGRPPAPKAPVSRSARGKKPARQAADEADLEALPV